MGNAFTKTSGPSPSDPKAGPPELKTASTARIITCSEPWFTAIVQGRKTTEGRRAGPTWDGVKTGDVIIINGPDTPKEIMATIYVEVTGVNRYKPGPNALRRFLEGEGLERVLPGISTIEAGENVYLSFPEWTRENVDERGMVGIQIQVLPE